MIVFVHKTPVLSRPTATHQPAVWPDAPPHGDASPGVAPLFGGLAVEQSRLDPCPGQASATTVSPLAALLLESTLPARLFLETTWAACVSDRLTSTLLQDVLPLDEPLQAVPMRHHGRLVAEWLENSLGDDQGSVIDSRPAEW